MRTTLTLADDVAAAVERLRRERAIGLSEAINDLVRAGLVQQQTTKPFRQKTHDLGDGIDYSNIADAIETLTLHSTDTDFARFSGLRWTNPLDDATAGAR